MQDKKRKVPLVEENVIGDTDKSEEFPSNLILKSNCKKSRKFSYEISAENTDKSRSRNGYRTNAFERDTDIVDSKTTSSPVRLEKSSMDKKLRSKPKNKSMCGNNRLSEHPKIAAYFEDGTTESDESGDEDFDVSEYGSKPVDGMKRMMKQKEKWESHQVTNGVSVCHQKVLSRAMKSQRTFEKEIVRSNDSN